MDEGVNYDINSLPKDILHNEICKYITPRDIYHLSFVSKHLNRYMRISTIKSVLSISLKLQIDIQLSKIFGNYLSEFYQSLDESNGVISGGFLLQCMLDETWFDSDVDIFMPHYREFSPIENFLYKFEGCKYVSHNSGSQYIGNLSIINNIEIDYIRNYNINGKVFQIIRLRDYNKNELMNRLDIVNFIRLNFDFDFLKNYYYNNTAWIYDLRTLSKTAFFDVTTDLISSIKRCKKYQERGFKFLNLGNIDLYSICNKCLTDKVDMSRQIELLTFIKSQDLLIVTNSAIKGIKESLPSLYQHISENDGATVLVYKDILKSRKELVYHKKECHDSCIINFLNLDINHIHIDHYTSRTYANNKTDMILMYIE